MIEIPNRPQLPHRYFSRQWRGIALSVLGLALVITGVKMALPHLQSAKAANTVTPGDWSMYMHDAGRSGYDSHETIINQGTAPHLKQHWAYHVGTMIYSQPVVAGGLIYWGSFDGYEHATKLNGQQAWSRKLGGNVMNCDPLTPHPLGIASSAAVVNGVVFVGGSNHTLYALKASNGQVLWSTLLGVPNSNTFIWDSPMVVNNNVYIGTGSTGENQGCKNVQGQFFELSASNGAIEHTFDPVPSGCTGAGIWGSPTYDASDGSIYLTTGNQSGQCNETNAVGLLKLSASDLTYVSSWQIPLAQRQVSDADFGTTPSLFTATINGIVHQMVGAVHKNGLFYAFDRAALSNGPLWTAQIAIAGNCPDCGDGSISPAVWWGGGMLYVAGGKTTINGQSCGGSLRALNPSNGAFLWQDCLPGTVLGAITDLTTEVAAVVDGSALTLVNSKTGAILFNNTANTYYGSPSVSNGVLYVGSTTGSLYAFGT